MKYIQAKNFVFSAKKAPQYGELFPYVCATSKRLEIPAIVQPIKK
jgi:hypothetical protein